MCSAWRYPSAKHLFGWNVFAIQRDFRLRPKIFGYADVGETVTVTLSAPALDWTAHYTTKPAARGDGLSNSTLEVLTIPQRTTSRFKSGAVAPRITTITNVAYGDVIFAVANLTW
jgi:hypothetical protein